MGKIGIFPARTKAINLIIPLRTFHAWSSPTPPVTRQIRGRSRLHPIRANRRPAATMDGTAPSGATSVRAMINHPNAIATAVARTCPTWRDYRPASKSVRRWVRFRSAPRSRRSRCPSKTLQSSPDRHPEDLDVCAAEFSTKRILAAAVYRLQLPVVRGVMPFLRAPH